MSLLQRMLGEEGLSEPNSELSVTAGVIPRFCRELFDRAHHLHLKNPPENQVYYMLLYAPVC